MSSILDSISREIPGINRAAERQAMSANDIMLQKQLGIPQQAAGRGSLQAQQAAREAQIKLESQGQTAEQMRMAAQMKLEEENLRREEEFNRRALQQEEMLSRERDASRRMLEEEWIRSKKQITEAEVSRANTLSYFGILQDNKLQFLSMKQREDLDKLGRDVKFQIQESRIQFERDEAGRKFSNMRQLADYNVAAANSRQEFDLKMKQMEMQSRRGIQIATQLANEHLEMARRGWIKEEGDLSRAHKLKLERRATELQEIARKKQSKARAHSSMWQAGGAIIGAIGGAVAGGIITAASGGTGAAVLPGTIAAGSALGASVGTGIGSSLGTIASEYND